MGRARQESVEQRLELDALGLAQGRRRLRIIMQIASISSAGLASVLAVINAKSVPGLDRAAVIPDAESADAVYEEGLSDLKRDGLLLPGARANTWSLNEDLLTAVMIMAGAEFVTRAVRTTAGGDRVELGFLAGTQVAELIPLVNDRYQISLLDSPALLAQRASALLRVGVTVGAGPSADNAPTGQFVVARAENGELLRARTALAFGDTLSIETGPAPGNRATAALTPEALADMLAAFVHANKGPAAL